MLKVKVPATSANLGVGFDALAIAFNIYNILHFEESEEYQFNGFQEEFCNQDNLVQKSYVAFCKKSNITPKPVTISLVQQDIPISRGLGSSASMIIAGVIAANEINHLHKSKDECAAFAATLEGHPDNVNAAFFGSLTASLKLENSYFHDTFKVSNALQFSVLVPSTLGDTESLRSELPSTVTMEHAVFHLARMIHVPKAFETGDVSLLKVLLEDRIHEHIRYRFIPDHKQLLQLKPQLEEVMVISGSGPSVLLIGSKELDNQLIESIPSSFTILEPTISNGTSWEVL